MNRYTPNNPPKSGKAKKIWRGLLDAGYTPVELHYNANCWGASKTLGWGSWACTIMGMARDGYFCGMDADGIYLEGIAAPYGRVYINER